MKKSEKTESQGYRLNRRRFVGSTLLGGAALTQVGKDSPTTAGRCQPAGLLGRRVNLTAARLLSGRVPEFTPEFVLADVALTPERRFNEYSGDLSGRYIGALALLPAKDSPARLRSLVTQLARYQRTDGRFGQEDLIFKADKIGPRHMALLWGNGRLLVGLLEYYEQSRDATILEVARRLGQFLLSVRRECSDPAVLKKLEGQGASGYICFTQLIEGLVLLRRATGDKSLVEAASSIVPLLQRRGIQHAHGYLSTLRGIMMLHEETGDSGQLAFVEEAYASLVHSPDYTEFGSVLEYFGLRATGQPSEDLSTIQQSSGKDPRDEGCGHADFLRLSLQLWKRTGKPEYLERAERCLWNGFFFNQFPTGDFGHHVCAGLGVKPTDNVARAWWCCTMHGYRTFPDILDAAVTEAGPAIRINLFEEVDWSGGDISLRVRRSQRRMRPLDWRVAIELVRAGGASRSIAVRFPRWAERAEFFLNGHPVRYEVKDGYATLQRTWADTDRLEVVFGCRLAVQLADGTTVAPGSLTADPVRALLTLGPWLMAVDSVREPLFFGEPQDNTLLLADAGGTSAWVDSGDPGVGLSLGLPYVHGGFPGRHPLVLRPVADAYRHEGAIVAVWSKLKLG